MCEHFQHDTTDSLIVGVLDDLLRRKLADQKFEVFITTREAMAPLFTMLERVLPETEAEQEVLVFLDTFR